MCVKGGAWRLLLTERGALHVEGWVAPHMMVRREETNVTVDVSYMVDLGGRHVVCLG